MSISHNSHAETPSRFIRSIDLAVKVLIRLSIFLGAAAALALVVNVFLDVALRFGMNSPIQGTNQFVSFWWMLPLVFFGLAAAQNYGEHTDLPIVYERLNPRGKQIVAIFSLICSGIFVAFIGWAGLTNAIDQMAVGEYDSSTGVTVWPPRFAIPLACLAFLLVILAEILKLIVDKDAVLSAEQEALGEEAEVLADLKDQNILTSDDEKNSRAPERTVSK